MDFLKSPRMRLAMIRAPNAAAIRLLLKEADQRRASGSSYSSSKEHMQSNKVMKNHSKRSRNISRARRSLTPQGENSPKTADGRFNLDRCASSQQIINPDNELYHQCTSQVNQTPESSSSECDLDQLFNFDLYYGVDQQLDNKNIGFVESERPPSTPEGRDFREVTRDVSAEQAFQPDGSSSDHPDSRTPSFVNTQDELQNGQLDQSTFIDVFGAAGQKPIESIGQNSQHEEFPQEPTASSIKISSSEAGESAVDEDLNIDEFLDSLSRSAEDLNDFLSRRNNMADTTDGWSQQGPNEDHLHATVVAFPPKLVPASSRHDSAPLIGPPPLNKSITWVERKAADLFNLVPATFDGTLESAFSDLTKFAHRLHRTSSKSSEIAKTMDGVRARRSMRLDTRALMMGSEKTSIRQRKLLSATSSGLRKSSKQILS
ncbi:hypothetical protein MMC25_006030 [Agyrium rufum]|nr:hypothetical protein [Agyrium rufum]